MHHTPPHYISVIVLALDVYSKVIDDMGDELDVFLFPELLPYLESKTELLNRIWDVVLGDNTFTLFSDIVSLLGFQIVFAVTILDASPKQLEV